MEIDKRISEKKAELMEIFSLMPEEKLKVAKDLIEQAAFLAVSLADLAEIITEEGMTEEYSNGKGQGGRKISSNAKMYSSLVGKYESIVARLLKMVPVKKEPVLTPAEKWLQEQNKRKAEEKAYYNSPEYREEQERIVREARELRQMYED